MSILYALVKIKKNCPRQDHLETTAKRFDVFNDAVVKLVSIGNSMICSDIWHKYHE